MTDWSHGYNVSTGYTYGFYRETAPDWIDFALALRGLQPPRASEGTPFRYLELGSGQGFGLCVLAAANPEGEFLGIDFSPEHTAHATALASRLGLTNVSFIEGDFAELGAAWPADFGRFDYVVLHGIYSWIPGSVRSSVISIIKEATAPGGVVYVSYNSMPGWTSTLPFQHMLRLLDERGPAQGMAAVNAGRALFQKLEAAGSGVTKALPALKIRIENTVKQPDPYLVQEYLHENWHPLWCSQVMNEMTRAKLDLAASATLAENLLPGILPKVFLDTLEGQDDPRVREDLVDCLINQAFRRDLFCRGSRQRFVGQTGWQDEYRFWRINASPVPSEIEIATAFGTIKIKAKQYAPLIGAIGEGSLSLAEATRLKVFKDDHRTLQQTLLLLVQAGWLGCARRTDARDDNSARCNSELATLATEGAPYRHVVAPSIGSAILASDSEMLMLACHIANPRDFERDPVLQLKQSLERVGRKLAKDGEPLSGDEEIAQLQNAASVFEAQTLPLWRRLGIVL